MKLHVKTFGCRVNQYESEKIREGFDRVGVKTSDCDNADIHVINTCSVTHNADKDARVAIRRILEKHPESKVIVTGCWATCSAEEIKRLFPKVLVVDNRKKDSIPQILFRGHHALSECSAPGITDFQGHSRAFIKIQDGCNMKCSYCIVPKARPKLSCRPVEDIISEIKGLLANGFREIVLCGIRLGGYLAKDSKGNRADLIKLLKLIDRLEGDFKIRLSSVEVTSLTDRFLGEYSEISRACDYFHVPLQSGSNRVLKSMRRWYNKNQFSERIRKVRSVLGADTGIYTDLMVGFPAETEEDFKQSEALARDLDFSGLHIFKFSARHGTDACGIEQVFTTKELKHRLLHIRSLDRALRKRFAEKFIGKKLDAMLEEKRGDVSYLRASNFIQVLSSQQKEVPGWRKVSIEREEGGNLWKKTAFSAG
ncbi:tRNA (N(6)-L-threonylcarbamoyladenosine(37)-C(2))-methylthiotransferase MtaB [Elusimicrobiota bacterium]